MSVVDIGFLFVVMTALALVPSASVALVVARSSTAGVLNGSAVAAGIVIGDLAFVCLAVLGMTALAETMGGVFAVVRYLGGAYLIWFGIRLVRSKPSFTTGTVRRSTPSVAASFLSGLLLTLGDVKAILFYASFFPAVVDLTAITASEVATIAAVTVLAVGGVKMLYVYSAAKVASFARGFKGARAIRTTAGGLMVGAGAYLVAKG